MDRREAIEIVRKNYPHVGVSGSEFETALRELVPELRESEDERIRKEIIEFINWAESRGSIRNDWHQKKCPENWVAYLEKQKGQKTARWKLLGECSDIPDGHYVVGWFHIGDFRLGIMCNGLFVDIDGNRAEQPKEVFYIPNTDEEFVYAEQKSAEKQDYDGLTDLEGAIHRGFLSAGVENVPITIIKETAQDCLAHISKPAEWSEEEKGILIECISVLQNSSHWLLADKLSSLRPQPHWKPSKDEITAIEVAVKYLLAHTSDEQLRKNVISVIEHLKQL